MPYKNKKEPLPEYPFVDSAELRRLRKRKKEELVAIVCYLSKRLGAAEDGVRDFIAATAESESQEEYTRRFSDAVRTVIFKTSSLMKRYAGIMPDMVMPPPTIVVHEVSGIASCDECPAREECPNPGECSPEEESEEKDEEPEVETRPAPQYDVSDVNVN